MKVDFFKDQLDIVENEIFSCPHRKAAAGFGKNYTIASAGLSQHAPMRKTRASMEVLLSSSKLNITPCSV
jgi:hypothetical protein